MSNSNLVKLFKNLLFLRRSYFYLFAFLIILSVIVAFSEIFLIGLVAEFLIPNESLGIYSKQLSFLFDSYNEGIIIIIIALFVLFIKFLIIQNTAKISFGLGAQLISTVFNKLIYQNINFFQKDDKSRHVAFLASKIEIVIHSLVLPLLNFSSGLIISFIYLIFLSYISIQLSSVVFLVILMAYGLPIFLSKNILKRVSNILSLDISRQVHFIKTGFEGFNDLKIWNLENYFSKQVRLKSQNISKAKTTSYVWSLVPRSLIEASAFIAIGIFLILVTDFNLFSSNSIIVVTFFLALLKVMPSFQQTYYSWQNLRSAFDIGSEMKAYLELENPIIDKYSGSKNFESLNIENVSFAFENDNNIFEDFSFKAFRGDKVAIFGKSGIGKSTLLNLISGVYQPNEGEILFNENLINQNQVNPFVSYISQSPFLFDLSIQENITLSFANNKKIDNERLAKALFHSGVQNYIDEKNLSLDYIVGEGGSNLSGGQAQRIAIARALYGGKELILLDEAMSALDNITKDFVITNLLKLKETLILITHDKEIYESFPIKINLNEINK